MSVKHPMHPTMKRIHDLVSLYYKALHEEPCSRNLIEQVTKKAKKQEDVNDHQEHVSVYGKSYCPYCQEAKSLIKTRPNAIYIELIKNYKPTSQAHVEHIEKSQTIPIVFVDDTLLGGLTELTKFINK